MKYTSKQSTTIATYSLFTLLAMTVSLPSLALTLANTQPPKISGNLQVGSTITVDSGKWNGDHPITFAYLYQICSASGTNCTTAPGLFPNGPRPALLLVAGTAGKTMRVRITATDLNGNKKSVFTPFTPPIASYPSNASPLIEFINGLPESISYSSKSIFQFQPTGSGVTLTCQLDNLASTTCPTNNKITYGNLQPGFHTAKVTAKNAYGSKSISYTWQVNSLPEPVPCTNCYKPPLGTTWQWQLSPDARQTGINPSIVADMYDIDGYNDASVVANLKSLRGDSVPNRSVTCYITAGTLENWRPDSEMLNPRILGTPYSGFTNERWIDVRQISTMKGWIETKMDMCKNKGFNAIEFDNVDGWQPANNTGLNITFEDEVAFIAYLANAAHQRGLSMAHKSNVEQIPQVLKYVDFAVVEECFAYQECTTGDLNTNGEYGYDMFIKQGKPVFEVEYKKYDPNNNVCTKAYNLGFATLYKNVDLDSYRVACPVKPPLP